MLLDTASLRIDLLDRPRSRSSPLHEISMRQEAFLAVSWKLETYHAAIVINRRSITITIRLIAQKLNFHMYTDFGALHTVAGSCVVSLRRPELKSFASPVAEIVEGVPEGGVIVGSFAGLATAYGGTFRDDLPGCDGLLAVLVKLWSYQMSASLPCRGRPDAGQYWFYRHCPLARSWLPD